MSNDLFKGLVDSIDMDGIIKAFKEILAPILERMKEMAKTFMENFKGVAQTIASFFHTFFGRTSKKRVIYTYTLSVELPIANYKGFVIHFLEHTSLMRKLLLISKQHNSNYFGVSFDF